MTVAFDYSKALTEIDRGYETQHVLTPSTEIARGVAMAPGVFRNGVLKTYLAFDASILSHLMDSEGYAASRLSASFYPEQVVHFEETFFAALDSLDHRVDAAMDTFRKDGDGWKCFRVVTGEYGRFLTFAQTSDCHPSAAAEDGRFSYRAGADTG